MDDVHLRIQMLKRFNVTAVQSSGNLTQVLQIDRVVIILNIKYRN